MSTGYNKGSHYQNHQLAAELDGQTAHANLPAAEHHGKQDHETGEERSTQALEHSHKAYLRTQQALSEGKHEHGSTECDPEEIATSGAPTMASQGVSGGLARRRLVPPLRAASISFKGIA